MSNASVLEATRRAKSWKIRESPCHEPGRPLQVLHKPCDDLGHELWDVLPALKAQREGERVCEVGGVGERQLLSFIARLRQNELTTGYCYCILV